MLSNLDGPKVEIAKLEILEDGSHWVEYTCDGQEWAHTSTPQWLAMKNSPHWVALRAAMDAYEQPSVVDDDDEEDAEE